MTRTLWVPLCQIEDRRGRKGRQYALPSLLGIAIAAMLAGANDLIAIFRSGRRLKPEALRLLGIDDGVAPCHATFHYFFKSLDADALAATLGRFALGEDRARHIAIDGKTLKGSRRLEAKPLHVLSAFASELGAVVGDLAVEPDRWAGASGSFAQAGGCRNRRVLNCSTWACTKRHALTGLACEPTGSMMGAVGSGSEAWHGTSGPQTRQPERGRVHPGGLPCDHRN